MALVVRVPPKRHDPITYTTDNRIYSILVNQTPDQITKIYWWFHRSNITRHINLCYYILRINMAMGKLSKQVYDLSDRLSLWWKSLTGHDPKQKALEMKQDYATPKRINTAIDNALGLDKNDKDRD